MEPDHTQRGPGRPVVTSHAEIEQAAFRLFDRRGYDGTTLSDIADAVGVGRRTLFRYYRSKNDIPWGQFDRTLVDFRSLLDSMPSDLPLRDTIRWGILVFNDFPAGGAPSHSERMRLILETPALQAHSSLRYAEWRAVISDFVARRLEIPVHHVLPQTVGHVSLALAMSPYGQWLFRPDDSLIRLLQESMNSLETYLQI